MSTRRHHSISMPSDRRIPIELLAPARDKYCAKAAIDHGADAVYIGASQFGARAAAGNSDEDIAEVIRYARPFGVRVYVTLNTLLSGKEELYMARDLAWRMYDLGVDALIVQDERLRTLPDFPPIPLHASTQMDNRTADKVRELYTQGYEQVVLARELTLKEISEIHDRVPEVALEVFIHGAICVSYNGRCFASEVCYGRSANRGECAQFCRMPYDLETADGDKIMQGRYLLSMRDMNRTDYLEALLDAGARSLKIEGRLKDATYVKNVTAWYRKRLDELFVKHPQYKVASRGKVELGFSPDPVKSFNRGFTDYFMQGRTSDICNTITPKSIGERVGFIKEIRRDHIVVAGTSSFSNGDGLCCVVGKEGHEQLIGFRINRAEGNHLYPHHMSHELRDGVVVYRNQNSNMENILQGVTSRRTLSVSWTLEEIDGGFRLIAESGDCRASREWECEHQDARTDQRESIIETLSKLGGTPYSIASADVRFSRPWFIPRSRLAEWRRQVLEVLGTILAAGSKGNGAGISNIGESNERILAPITDVAPQKSDTSPLMTCRYCIRYQLGECLRKNPNAIKGPLYLRGADGRRFLLRFDCKNCRMMVELS